MLPRLNWCGLRSLFVTPLAHIPQVLFKLGFLASWPLPAFVIINVLLKVSAMVVVLVHDVIHFFFFQLFFVILEVLVQVFLLLLVLLLNYVCPISSSLFLLIFVLVL